VVDFFLISGIRRFTNSLPDDGGLVIHRNSSCMWGCSRKPLAGGMIVVDERTLALQAFMSNPDVSYWGVYEIPLDELEALPVLHQGQADDCHIDTGTERVWLSRCGTEDGMPWNNMVTVERYIGGSWIEVEWYEAK
jgi:hypothetical protein